MAYNFKISYSINKTYIAVLPAVVLIIAVMCYFISIAYQISVEKEKNLQITSAVRLRLTDMENWLNHFFDVESNFNTSINTFQTINSDFNSSFFKDYIEQQLTKYPEIGSFWVWFAPNAFAPPATIDGTFSYSATAGFFIRLYKDHSNTIQCQQLTGAELTELLQFGPVALPQVTQEFTLSEPYICPYLAAPPGDSITFQIASFSSPIFDAKHEVVGVTGFDMGLDNISKLVNSLATNVYTKVCLLSQGGLYYSHFDRKRLGKHVKQNTVFSNQPHIADSILKYTAAGKPFDVDIINKGLTGIDTTVWDNTVHFNNIQLTHTKSDYVTSTVFMQKSKFNVDYYQFRMTLLYYALLALLIVVLGIVWLALVSSNILNNRIYMQVKTTENND